MELNRSRQQEEVGAVDGDGDLVVLKGISPHGRVVAPGRPT